MLLVLMTILCLSSKLIDNRGNGFRSQFAESAIEPKGQKFLKKMKHWGCQEEEKVVQSN